MDIVDLLISAMVVLTAIVSFVVYQVAMIKMDLGQAMDRYDFMRRSATDSESLCNSRLTDLSERLESLELQEDKTAKRSGVPYPLPDGVGEEEEPTEPDDGDFLGEDHSNTVFLKPPDWRGDRVESEDDDE